MDLLIFGMVTLVAGVVLGWLGASHTHAIAATAAASATSEINALKAKLEALTTKPAPAAAPAPAPSAAPTAAPQA